MKKAVKYLKRSAEKMQDINKKDFYRLYAVLKSDRFKSGVGYLVENDLETFTAYDSSFFVTKDME